MGTKKSEFYETNDSLANGDLCIPREYKRERAQAIYSEGYHPKKDFDKDEEGIAYEKSVSQNRKLMAVVKECLLFKNLDEEEKSLLIGAMFKNKVEENHCVIQQGNDGDNFYIIDEGIFEMFIDGELVNTFNNYGSFGELALMYNIPREETVRAKSDGFLWVLDRQTYRKIVLRGSFQKRKMYEELIAKVPIFQQLSSYEKANVSDALIPKYYKKGDIIFKQGQAADGMYFIETGTVEVWFSSEQTEKKLKEIKQGGYFGELALVIKKPRTLTMIAASNDVKCAFLQVDAFEQLLGPCIDIMKRSAAEFEIKYKEIFEGNEFNTFKYS